MPLRSRSCRFDSLRSPFSIFFPPGPFIPPPLFLDFLTARRTAFGAARGVRGERAAAGERAGHEVLTVFLDGLFGLLAGFFLLESGVTRARPRRHWRRLIRLLGGRVRRLLIFAAPHPPRHVPRRDDAIGSPLYSQPSPWHFSRPTLPGAPPRASKPICASRRSKPPDQSHPALLPAEPPSHTPNSHRTNVPSRSRFSAAAPRNAHRKTASTAPTSTSLLLHEHEPSVVRLALGPGYRELTEK